MLYYISFSFILILFLNILKVKNFKGSWSTTILAIILSTFIATIYIFLLVLLILRVYRLIVYLIARIKYGRNFIGFVEGTDASNCTSKNLTTVLLILHNKTNEDVYEVVKEIIDVKILQNQKTLPKFHAAFTKFMGYQCYIKNSFSIQDCVKKLPTCENKEINRRQLLDLLSECYAVPLPNNETVLWDVFVGVQSLQWKTGKNYYPVVARIHNAIVQKPTLLKLFTEVLADSTVTETLPEHKRHSPYAKILIVCLHSFMSYLNTLFLSPSLLLEGFKYKGEERNIIHKPIISRKEVLAFKVEEFAECVEKIKRIKTQIPSCTFSDVVITAFSESLKDYFQKRSVLNPEYLTSAVQIQDTDNLSTSTVFINLPLFLEGDKDSLVNRLNVVKAQTDFSQKIMEIQAGYFLSDVACSVIPSSAIQYALEDIQCSSTLCFVPGPQQVTFKEGKVVVSESFFWLPQKNSCGINLSLMTYDNRLHIALNCDQIYIRSLDDVQEMLEEIFKNVDKLEEEILCIK